MNIFETIQLAIKSILANRLRSFLTVLGIVIGVTSVILLVSMVSGLQNFITAEINSLGSNIIFVVPGRIGGGRGPGGTTVNRLNISNVNYLKSNINGDAEISAAITKVSTLKRLNKSSKDATVFGVDANFTQILKAFELTEGRFFNQSEVSANSRVTVIGPTARKNLFGESSPLNQQIQVGNLKYTVIGVLAPPGLNFRS